MLCVIFKLTDDVTKKKFEYQRNLDTYKSMRSRFEEYYIKGEFYIQYCPLLFKQLYLCNKDMI